MGKVTQSRVERAEQAAAASADPGECGCEGGFDFRYYDDVPPSPEPPARVCMRCGKPMRIIRVVYVNGAAWACRGSGG